MGPKSYLVRRRFFDGEWRMDDIEIFGSFQKAGEAASNAAAELDAIYGDEHFWTVDLFDNPKSESGSYFQLFHGRLS